jgi:hypothetical protein
VTSITLTLLSKELSTNKGAGAVPGAAAAAAEKRTKVKERKRKAEITKTPCLISASV